MKAILDDTPIEIEDSLANLLLYSFGVYSSFIVSDGNMVRGWEYHIERVQRDAKEFLGIEVSREAISKSVMEFVKGQDPSVEMTCRVTIYPSDFNLGAPHKAGKPKFLVTGRSGSSLSGKPLKLTISECDRPFATHKITNIGAAMKERARAKSSGFDDALFTANRRISEGPTWNVFFIRGGKVQTPEDNGKILPGVTRRMIMELLGSSVEEQSLTSEDLENFDAAFATNAAIGVVPIQSIDSVIFDHENGLVKSLQERYLTVVKNKIF